jgi:mlo protein
MSSEATLEQTPTWIVASVCSVIVLISLVFERALHHLGKVRNPRPPAIAYKTLQVDHGS